MSTPRLEVQHGSRSSAILDLARIVAALAVFAGHLRNVLFVDHQQVEGGGAITRAATSGFYAVTGLGHQAVIVFFVLSGLFIGQAIRYRHAPGATWSWGHYLIDRLSRLHIVLIPALVLTLVADLCGQALMPELYAGQYPGGLLPAGLEERHSPAAFFVNAFYLQTIAGPTFGSNGPLWSLAYELWFYLLFPLALRVAIAPKMLEKGLAAAALVGSALIVGEGVLFSFPIWLLGTALVQLPRPTRHERLRRLLPWATFAVFMGVLALTRVGGGWWKDYALGLACALWVWSIIAMPGADTPPRSRAWKLAITTAAFSYTLYAIHLPLVFLARALLGDWQAGGRSQPGLATFALYFGLIAAIGLIAWGFARLTEDQTGQLRRWLRKRVGLERARPT